MTSPVAMMTRHVQQSSVRSIDSIITIDSSSEGQRRQQQQQEQRPTAVTSVASRRLAITVNVTFYSHARAGKSTLRREIESTVRIGLAAATAADKSPLHVVETSLRLRQQAAAVVAAHYCLLAVTT